MEELRHEMCGSSDGAHTTLWSAHGDSILFEILKRRYALGEITRERFEEVRRWMGMSDTSVKDEPTSKADDMANEMLFARIRRVEPRMG